MDDLFIIDGGLETTLILHLGYDLPKFAAFTGLKLIIGHEILPNYYQPYKDLVVENEINFIPESGTWWNSLVKENSADEESYTKMK